MRFAARHHSETFAIGNNLSYNKALDIAKGMEAADQNTKAFRTTEPTIKALSGRPPKPSDSRRCYRCGRTNHGPADCKFRDAQCRSCGKTGHIAPVCRSKPLDTRPKKKQDQARRRDSGKTHRVQDDDQSSDHEDSSDNEYLLHKLGERSSDPIEVQMLLNGKKLDMEVDTGAALSIISEATRKFMFADETLHPSSLVLKTYTDERMEVMGTLNMQVQYGEQKKKLVLVVVGGNGPSLLGRNWLKHIKLDWSSIVAVRTIKMKPLHTLMQRHQQLFSEGLGLIEPFTATLHVRPDTTPRFFKPRQVPFAIRDTIGQEIDRMEKQGILEPVTHSNWAAPIVAVPKKDGRFRICGDYKAYLQLPLDEASKPYVAINTHKGLYTCTRLPFGVASAPAIFQKLMDTVLQGIPGVVCYIDDILISGADEETHLRTLGQVFARLEKHGFKLKQEKCGFLLRSIEYLGHIISQNGIQPVPTKVTAILNAPKPINVQQLRSFLGLVNYGKFIPNLATLLHPLNALLRADRKWKWSPECDKAFQDAKDQLTSAKVLTHYNPTLPIVMAADASAYGVGAVISHVFPDSSERPIAFASRTLTTSEKNYAQLEKEALALVFGVRKFHQYLYGRPFTLITDHQPLTTILGPKKGIPSLAAARLQRWAILLSAYKYSIRYKSTTAHGNADGLSRLPLPTTSAPTDEGVSTFNIGQVQALPVTFQDIQKATRRDKVLSKISVFVQEGWPNQVDEELKPYNTRQAEIGIEGGCLMWGIRVIIPESLQPQVLKSLHESHPGISRMKAIARSYFWWNGLDKDIENLGKSCQTCQAVQSHPATAPLHPWVWPDAPWKRIHVDFAGPFLGHMFFVVMDAYSKWPEVVIMSSTTSQKTIEVLRSMFARHGLPEQLVSDNGPQFTSTEFADFMKGNRIKHILSAPYHPASNGLAERFVQTLKRAMKASAKDGKTLPHRLAEFLFTYRSTPHATTNVSPSELFQQRKLRTRFNLMKPDIRGYVTSKQAQQKQYHDKHAKPRFFFPGTPVMVRSFQEPNKWIPGIILQKLGPVTYQVEIANGRIQKRHIEHLILRRESSSVSTAPDATQLDSAVRDNYHYPQDETIPAQLDRREPEQPVVHRYPQRHHHPPERLMVVTTC